MKRQEQIITDEYLNLPTEDRVKMWETLGEPHMWYHFDTLIEPEGRVEIWADFGHGLHRLIFFPKDGSIPIDRITTYSHILTAGPFILMSPYYDCDDYIISKIIAKDGQPYDYNIK